MQTERDEPQVTAGTLWPHLIAPAALIIAVLLTYSAGVRADGLPGGADDLGWAAHEGNWLLLFSAVLATGVAIWAWISPQHRRGTAVALAYVGAVALGIILGVAFTSL